MRIDFGVFPKDNSSRILNRMISQEIIQDHFYRSIRLGIFCRILAYLSGKRDEKNKKYYLRNTRYYLRKTIQELEKVQAKSFFTKASGMFRSIYDEHFEPLLQ